MVDVASVANLEGIYRCSGDGQTVYSGKGIELPQCSCGKGEWLFFKADNMEEENSCIVLVKGGLLFAFETDESPEFGKVFHLRAGMEGVFCIGYYRVLTQDTMIWCGEEYFCVTLSERIEEHNEDLPIHLLSLLTI